MSVTLINEIEVTTVQVVVMFEATLDISTIKNSKFPVYNMETGSPVAVSDPFEDIVVADDYNSISKVLTLTWNSGVLLSNTDYKITFTNLEQPDGSILDDVDVTFTTGSSVTAAPSEIPTAATPVTVVDYSLISDAFTTSVISPTSLSFVVTDTDPENGEYYIEQNYENGRATIKFSRRPDAAYVSSTYIKVQRKAIQRAPARWETLTARFVLDDVEPWVYVDFPPEDHYPEAATPWDGATPALEYASPGWEYYEENYEYRIIVSKDLTSI